VGPDADVIPVSRVELGAAPWRWPFAIERRADIDEFFARQQRDNPALWNGRLLLLREFALDEGVLRGSLFETDYASMIAGIEWGTIRGSVKACFVAAALMSADGAFLAGLMADHTRNAGQIVFPSGSIDPEDVRGGSVDMEASVRRELEEETGLDAAEVEAEPGWHVVIDGPRMPVFKVVRAGQPAAELRNRIMARLARQPHPEFADMRIIRAPADLGPTAPAWMRAFVAYAQTQAWRERAR
jgi:8-oxo-dGTP pyrophosphatase MutT (NUDIX family)